MTDFGNSKSYDSSKGTGNISPEKGGNALPFRKSDMQQQAQEPQQGEGDVQQEQARAQQARAQQG